MARLTKLVLATVLFASLASAQSPIPPTETRRVIYDSRPDPDAIQLYGKGTPGSVASENWLCLPSGDCTVRNVTRPTLTPVLPALGKANGAAVVILPGGGFMSLALDLEGFNVARALAARGITAFVLKYRLMPTPSDIREAQPFIAKVMKDVFSSPEGPSKLFYPDALLDGQAALRLVRARADEWSIDPNRLGMIGFSAGARTVLQIVMESPAAERPRFFGYIYGDMASKPVPADAPPMFAAIAFDDNLYPKGNLALAQDWHAAKRKVELHVYQTGSHGFGLGRPGTTNSLLADQFVAWLSMQGFLKQSDKK